MDKSDCPVCYEPFADTESALQECNHWVHRECILKSFKPECPLCRCEIKLTPEEARQVNRNHVSVQKDWDVENEREIFQLVREHNNALQSTYEELEQLEEPDDEEIDFYSRIVTNDAVRQMNCYNDVITNKHEFFEYDLDFITALNEKPHLTEEDIRACEMALRRAMYNDASLIDETMIEDEYDSNTEPLYDYDGMECYG